MGSVREHMVPMAKGPSQFIAELVVQERIPQRVLDIAAGHGLYGIAVASVAPHAQVVAQDWPKVLAVAAQMPERGVAGTASPLARECLFTLILERVSIWSWSPTFCTILTNPPVYIS